MNFVHTRTFSMVMVPLAFLVAGSLCAAIPAHALTTIDTTPSWDGMTSQGPWGEPDTATFGQSFTAPTGVASLTDFTFYLTEDSTPVSIPYEAYVYAWDGSEATGSALYTSGLLNTGVLGSGFTIITTTPAAAVAVTPGQQYVAFFSTSGVQDGVTNLADWGYTGVSTGLTGGSFAYLNSGNDSTLFTVPGGWGVDPNDLAFKADFTPSGTPPAVPETTPLAFVTLGLPLLLAMMARKHRATRTA